MEAKQLIQDACDLVNRVEPRLGALVAEPNRLRRLLAEAERQDPTLRPFLVGVKDIVNVAGLPTRAGATLPGDPRGRGGFDGHTRGRRIGGLGSQLGAGTGFVNERDARTPVSLKRGDGSEWTLTCSNSDFVNPDLFQKVNPKMGLSKSLYR